MPSHWKKATAALLFILTALFTWGAQGPVYAVAILSILIAQEAAREFVARKHGTPAALPLFLPMPYWFGTLGTLRVAESPLPSGRALLDEALAPAIVGSVLALGYLIAGLLFSSVLSTPPSCVHLAFQYPWIVRLFARLLIGSSATGAVLALHPLAIAGWAGLTCTMLSLFPIGHLHGARIAQALAPQWAGWIQAVTLAFLVVLGLWANPLWIFFLVIIVFIAFRLPPPVDTQRQPIDIKRIIAIAVLFLLGILSFTPIPFELTIGSCIS